MRRNRYEVEKFISAADSQSAVSAQSDGSEDTESVQTGGNEYQPPEDGYVILPKDVSYKDIDYEITDVDEDTGEGTIRYIYMTAIRLEVQRQNLRISIYRK